LVELLYSPRKYSLPLVDSIVTLTTTNGPSAGAAAPAPAPSASAPSTSTSMEGVVTFSGGAVAFPASTRPAGNSSVAENHVTITPVSAPIMSTSTVAPVVASVTTPSTAPATAPVVAPATATTATAAATKARPRPIVKGQRLSDAQSASSSPTPQVDPSLQFMCEWKDCMK